MAYAIARKRRMEASELSEAQAKVADRFEELIIRQLMRFPHEVRKHIYKMAAVFEE